MLISKKAMVSWQAFPSLLPRAPLVFLSRLKLPFPSLSNACHAGYNFEVEDQVNQVNPVVSDSKNSSPAVAAMAAHDIRDDKNNNKTFDHTRG